MAEGTATQDKPKKAKKPRPVAFIHEEGCTGCEACIVVCPVDCIIKVPYESSPLPGVNEICRVIEETCIGCTICAIDCPWDTIEMLKGGKHMPHPDFPKRWKFK